MQRFVRLVMNVIKSSRRYDIRCDCDALISFIIEYGIESSRVNFTEAMPDEDDRVFYEVSLSQEDSFLVTGNLKHYPTSPCVITPAQFLEVL